MYKLFCVQEWLLCRTSQIIIGFLRSSHC